jgi:asparagine synthase (glutamine-hydrolysing)
LLHLADAGDPTIRAYQTCRNLVPSRNVRPYLSPNLLEELTDLQGVIDKLYPSTDLCVDDFQRASVLESVVYMGSQLMRDMDNFSMAHSIELRAPYLDHELFEYVLTLPVAFKQNPGRTKPLLAGALPLPLPQEILKQRKRGFAFPVEHWLKSHMAASFETFALSPANAEFWNMGTIEQTWQAYLSGRTHWSLVWNLYAFARWVHDHRAA